MKVFKFIRKNYILLLILLIIAILLIKYNVDGFDLQSIIIGNSCILPDVTIFGTCTPQYTYGVTNIWDGSKCITTRQTCKTGYIYTGNNQCLSISYPRKIEKSVPLVTYPAEYNCPSGYRKLGDFICAITPVGTYKCPTGYPNKSSSMCYRSCGAGYIWNTSNCKNKRPTDGAPPYTTPESTEPICSS